MKKYREGKQPKFIKYKIVVPTEKDKKELQKAFEYLHNLKEIDTDYIAVNQLVHEYEDVNNFVINNQYWQSEFKKELESLINKHSLENDSNTPDYILADYLFSCLEAFNSAQKTRHQWYNK